VTNVGTNSNHQQVVPIHPQLHERQHGRFIHLCFAAGSSSGEKEEWRAILASFQLYKAAYGDLKVPTRFVVPSMKPWPGESISGFSTREVSIEEVLVSSAYHFSALMHILLISICRGRLGTAAGEKSFTNSFRRQIH
jgi:hypothetical protein